MIGRNPAAPGGRGTDLELALLGRVLLAFEGELVPDAIAQRLANAPAAGMTLFRHLNVRTPGQVRELTAAFQRAGAASPHAIAATPLAAAEPTSAAEPTPAAEPTSAPGPAPLLVGADQESGQLQALGDGATCFAGNMALGAVDDVALTERVGRAIGLEARAMGVNVVYAPDLDLAIEPASAVVGIRSFGDDPAHVARHGAAMVRGLQSAGVAATVKHFPGSGRAAADPHHGGALVAAVRSELEAADLAPFRAAFAAGARVTMSGHVAVPALTGSDRMPATLSAAVMTSLLRGELGFAGASVSDALDMGAIVDGRSGSVDVAGLLRAGVDLLLTTADPAARARLEDALREIANDRGFDEATMVAPANRIGALRSWFVTAGPQPDLSVVGTPAHHALAGELAARSITLANDPGRLPLRIPGDARLLAVMPRPADLTPADTSSTVEPSLAAALRRHHAVVEELVVDQSPDADTIAAGRARAREADAIVIGTTDAHRQPAQRTLFDAVVEAAGAETPVVLVAMRGPWDVGLAPAHVTALATYSVLPRSLEALADVLFAGAAAPGRLPVRIATSVAPHVAPSVAPHVAPG